MAIRINKQKRIGKTLFIVEGELTEPTFLQHIFNDILGYSCYTKTRNSDDLVVLKGHDINSSVTIINSKNNNICSLKNATDYYDYIEKEIEEKHHLNFKNASVYYIFDRDLRNNKLKILNELAEDLSSSQNDTEEKNGLLLLSYPSIESLLLNMFEAGSCKTTCDYGRVMKQMIIDKKLDIASSGEKELINATNELLCFISDICQMDITKINLDDFSSDNLKMIEVQQNQFKLHQNFFCVSQIVFALIDLQIIEIV